MPHLINASFLLESELEELRIKSANKASDIYYYFKSNLSKIFFKKRNLERCCDRVSIYLLYNIAKTQK